MYVQDKNQHRRETSTGQGKKDIHRHTWQDSTRKTLARQRQDRVTIKLAKPKRQRQITGRKRQRQRQEKEESRKREPGKGTTRHNTTRHGTACQQMNDNTHSSSGSKTRQTDKHKTKTEDKGKGKYKDKTRPLTFLWNRVGCVLRKARPSIMMCVSETNKGKVKYWLLIK